jgi:hypothetical protein
VLRRRLTGLEAGKLRDEATQLRATITDLQVGTPHARWLGADCHHWLCVLSLNTHHTTPHHAGCRHANNASLYARAAAPHTHTHTHTRNTTTTTTTTTNNNKH